MKKYEYRGVIDAIPASRNNWRTPERLAFIDRLNRDGWHHVRLFTLSNFCEVFVHKDIDYAVKVSTYYVPERPGWLEFAQWAAKRQAAGVWSPYIPKIWDLEVHDKWFAAKMERLQELNTAAYSEYLDLFRSEIDEIKRRFESCDFSINDGDNPELVRLLRDFTPQFPYLVPNFIEPCPYPHWFAPDGWGRLPSLGENNFMIRPGAKPQLVMIDPVPDDWSPESMDQINEVYDAKQQTADERKQAAEERRQTVLNLVRVAATVAGIQRHFCAKRANRAGQR